MSGDRVLSAVCVAMGAGVLILSASAASAQSAAGAPNDDARWSPPRTAWGAPDLQGVWDYRTMTPLQRPREFTGKTVMSPEEAASTRRTVAFPPSPRTRRSAAPSEGPTGGHTQPTGLIFVV